MPGTVSVVSKLAHSLILQLQTPVIGNEPVMGGGSREVTTYRRQGPTVTIKGAAHPFGRIPDLTGGFNITHGIDADFFAAWLEQNRGLDAVENGFIYAAPKPDSALAHAREFAKEMTGLEPTDPENLPAEFKKSIATADVGG